MLTGMLILAVSVLPHHHHHENAGKGICFSFSLTGEADHHHNHDEDRSCERNKNEAACDLRNIFVTSARNDGNQCHCTAGADNDAHNTTHHFFIDLFLTDCKAYFNTPEKWLKNNKPLSKEPLRSVFTQGPRSMRAPPVESLGFILTIG